MFDLISSDSRIIEADENEQIIIDKAELK